MKVADFDFQLPAELIAQRPLDQRDAARMLVLYRNEQRWEDKMFRDLPHHLAAGDVLVLNNSKVIPARLSGKRGAAEVEVLLLRAVSPLVWQALVRPGKKLHTGQRIVFADNLTAEVIAEAPFGERTLRFDTTGDLAAIIDRIGHMPLPPYIRRHDTGEDRSRYQTVFAESPGSAAAPTAGLHFTPAMLDACRQAGATIASLTMHVGLGTFQPLREELVERVRLHAEQYSVEATTAGIIRSAPRVLTVGTTSTRTVETLARSGYQQLTGETDLFLYPGATFLRVNAMLTNFHLPKSSLLMLVCAFAGTDLALAAYRHAVSERYRFYSYGDCMLIV